ncbi:7287_t:CDS:2 [Paraglomus occultum]|uniref:7287_t:CDS:1 n=1 Tax=Paraglomus occultum TaxID=144539 RepID=A0A9N9D2Z4_9GLOM|nr:7287_t:CDS:2 [Paraglomus occultum]
MNIQQAYQDAKKEYDDVKAKLERFDELSIKTELSVAERKDERSPESDAKRRRQEIFEHYPPEAPSARATPSNFARLQGNFEKDHPILHCGRPLWTSIVPITLLHPIFRSFLQKLETYEPMSVDNAFVLDLSNSMSKWYEHERFRAAAFHGHALANNYPYLITGCKNEIGNSGADAYLQGGLYYYEFMHKLSLDAPASTLPCLHIFYFGAFFGFTGSAISKNGVHLEVLLPVYLVIWHLYDTIMQTWTARVFGAFMWTVNKLRSYYEHGRHKPLWKGTFVSLPNTNFLYKHEYAVDNATMNFKYTKQHSSGKLIFFGETTAGDVICIKYTRSYSAAAHRYLASLGVALRLCGFEQLPHKWYMVVMDMMDQAYLPYSHQTKDKISFPSIEVLRHRVEEVVNTFHEQNFVHGDLRDTNLFVQKNGEGKFMLIDFDWSGMAGEDHDLDMLEIMFGRSEQPEVNHHPSEVD